MVCEKTLGRSVTGREFFVLTLAGIGVYWLLDHLLLDHLTDDTSRGDSLSAADSDWLKTRQDLLGREDVPTKVLLVAYMRGGSSVGGEMFNNDPETILWYEPLSAYFDGAYGVSFNRGSHDALLNSNLTLVQFSHKEKQHIAKFLGNLLTCELEAVPDTTIVHPHVTGPRVLHDVKRCVVASANSTLSSCPNAPCGPIETARQLHCHTLLQEAKKLVATTQNSEELATLLERFVNQNRAVMGDGVLDRLSDIAERLLCIEKKRAAVVHCLQDAKSKCQSRNLRVLEVIRIKIEDLEEVLKLLPDLYVIHYVRDPRATSVSRQDTASLKLRDGNVTEESRVLCQQMRADLDWTRRLQARYPSSFYQLRYEDLVTDPLKTTSKVYSFLGRYIPARSRFLEFAQNSFSDKRDNNNAFATSRANGTTHISQWRSRVSASELSIMNSACADVLRQLNYPR